MAFHALDSKEPINRYRNHLPHWSQAGVTCFVTFRLGDSIPRTKLESWECDRRRWLAMHGLAQGEGATVEDLPEELRREYHLRFTSRFHRWLDAGHGACWLRHPECAAAVAGALHFFDGDRYALEAFVVMPNHVHVLVTPQREHELSNLLHSWKSFTSNQINELTNQSGALWQKESYDHLVRSEGQFVHYRRYIRDNPVKGRLHVGEFLWWDSLGEPN